MAGSTSNRIPTPPTQRWDEFRHRRLPIVVWVLAAAISVWMLGGRATRGEYVGLAQALSYPVSATTVGRVETMNVGLYDQVDTGQVLARLADDEIEARLERSHATIRQLSAQLAATRAQLATTSQIDQASWVADLRRFQADEEDRRIAALELQVTIETDDAQLQKLAHDLERATPMVDSGLIGRSEHEATRLLHDEVATRLEETRELLAETEAEYRTALARRQQFERGLPSVPEPEPLLMPLREAIAVETQRLREIQARRDATVLRAPAAGKVSQVLARRGQTVMPGETILTVTDPAVSEILAYLGHEDDRVVLRNDPVLVARTSNPAAVAESVVTRVAPGLDVIPERLWRHPSTPEYGRAVVISSVSGLGVTPGELLTVRFMPRR